MNKKAISFAVGMVILAIAVTTFAFYTLFFLNSERITDVTSPLDLINIQNDAREDLFFIKESANYASQQALYSVFNEIPMESSCISYNGIKIWNNCKPSIKKTEEKFLEKFVQQFYSILKTSKKDIIKNLVGKYNFEINGNVLRLQSGKALEYHTLLKIHALYRTDVSFNYELPFAFDILDEIRTKSMSAVSFCKDNTDVLQCINNNLDSNINGFDFNLDKKGDYIILTAKTKDRFIFNNSSLRYDKISFKYAISLI